MKYMTSEQTGYLILGGVGLLAGWWLFGRASAAVSAGADVVGGIASGNNSLTQGSPYQGAGILGTLGAATNTLLGGAPQAVGEWLGGAMYDLSVWEPWGKK